MKSFTSLVFAILISGAIQSQEIDLSKKWIISVETSDGFQIYDTRKFDKIDLSKMLSNQLRFEKDPISTYIGVFGPNYRRIDFHMKVSKKELDYSVSGKSKLGVNVREIKGEMRLRQILLRRQNYITDSLYIGLFDCELHEPGDREGDGIFSGIFTLVFHLKDNEAHFFKTSSGDEPNFTNTFVGTWRRNNSNIERQVIFSFHAAGLYETLPFCEELYDYEFSGRTIIKEKYLQFGWQDYSKKRGQKTSWWEE